MTILIIVILLAVLFMIWLVTVQRKLVAMEENIRNAMSQIGVQLSMCFDAMTMLLQTAEGYAADETRPLSEDLRSFRITVTARSTPDQVQGQDRILSEVAEHLIAIAETYPDFKADKNYVRYMDTMGCYRKMVYTSCLIYNDTVAKYQRFVRMAPVNMVAPLLGFSRHGYLESVEKGWVWPVK